MAERLSQVSDGLLDDEPIGISRVGSNPTGVDLFVKFTSTQEGPRSVMDIALDFESKGCGFNPHRGLFFLFATKKTGNCED